MLRLVGLTDSAFPAVEILLRLNSAAEDKAALIAYQNYFHYQKASISAFTLIINYKFPQEGAAGPKHCSSLCRYPFMLKDTDSVRTDRVSI